MVQTQSKKGDPVQWRNNAPTYHDTLSGALEYDIKHVATKGVAYETAKELLDKQRELVGAVHAMFGNFADMNAAEFYKKYGGKKKPVIEKTSAGDYELVYIDDEPEDDDW
jgi:hypothetical protein